MTLNLHFKPTSPIPCCIFFSGNHRPRARGWSCSCTAPSLLNCTQKFWNIPSSLRQECLPC